MTSSFTITQAFDCRMLRRDEHAPLEYYVGGSGPAWLAIVNAYGQSLAFWEPLVALLERHYKILIWQPRGNRSSHGGMTHVCSMEDHVSDMRRLFAVEEIDRAHLLGWCTGPRTLLSFQAENPAQVASMTLLSGCFIQLPAQLPFYTRYEQAMVQLCNLVDQRPTLAIPFVKMFQNICGTQLRASGSEAVDALVRAPFTLPADIVHYARQLLSFWQHDISMLLPRIAAPAMLITGSADNITHPALSREIARSLPNATYVDIEHGSHYLHYEQPTLVAKLITGFTRRKYDFSELGASVHTEKFSAPRSADALAEG